MNLDNIKVSIITINYNAAEDLRKTISSVVNQTYRHIEFIVIDGGSTDGSQSVIHEYSDHINYWVSEPDGGIFNAMNKGIIASSGEYLIFINSGDVIAGPGVVASVVDSDLTADIVYGNLIFSNGISLRHWIPDAVPTFRTFFRESIPHPSAFIKRALFNVVGLYNEQFKIVADWEFFMLALCRYNCSYKYIDRVIAVFEEGGISSNPANYSAMVLERNAVLSQHFPFFVKDYEDFDILEREFKKIEHFANARYAVKRALKKLNLGPS